MTISRGTRSTNRITYYRLSCRQRRSASANHPPHLNVDFPAKIALVLPIINRVELPHCEIEPP